MATFEEQLDELERVVGRLEVGGLGLAESVDLFENGMRLANACKAELASAESRIRVLTEPDKKGSVKTEDLEVDLDGDYGEGEALEDE